MIASPEHTIIVSPIGDLDSKLIEQVRKKVSKKFGYKAETLSLLRDTAFALDPARNQYYSTKILERLAGLAPRDAIKLIAICDVDLFIPILTHVYGEAQLGGKACIISTYRLGQDLPPINAKKTFHHRVLKEAIHEMGHTFNLRHCHDKSCGMHYCRAVKDVDDKSERFCRYCTILLDDEIKRLLRQGSA